MDRTIHSVGAITTAPTASHCSRDPGHFDAMNLALNAQVEA